MSHWQKYHARWSQIHPPLRPNEHVIECIQHHVGKSNANTFLLGVTPELADAFDRVYAVDKNAAMIANVWPGNSATKTAVEGDWLNIELPDDHYDAVIGDGSLNNIRYPDEIATLLQRVLRTLKPGGTFACRLFESPEFPYSESHLRRISAELAPFNFHAFKWQLAMHLAAERDANVPVATILDLFNRLCPDRKTLSDTTGWPPETIGTIDVYAGSPISYSFPTRQQFRSILPESAVDVRFIKCGAYDLAERCPILTFRKA